ncbi:MAG: DNA-directed RNA polymerase subunit omega [Planctomycetes bacterium]|jgi:DNA-directed RNA polymerase subunit omega|nr:DNA-directed RNA polymerase subunit omega [Planctomycetota bacterium]
MHDDLKEESIVDKVGGRFKLSALIQKRMAELMRNAKPQVDYRGPDRLGLIIEEIKQGKIVLDTSTASKQSVLGAQEAVRRAMAGDISGDLSAD